METGRLCCTEGAWILSKKFTICSIGLFRPLPVLMWCLEGYLFSYRMENVGKLKVIDRELDTRELVCTSRENWALKLGRVVILSSFWHFRPLKFSLQMTQPKMFSYDNLLQTGKCRMKTWKMKLSNRNMRFWRKLNLSICKNFYFLRFLANFFRRTFINRSLLIETLIEEIQPVLLEKTEFAAIVYLF